MELKSKLEALQEKIGYTFKDIKILEMALTHSSMNVTSNNQRLEFLGDRVLGLIICDYLYKNYIEEEGKLAKRLNFWVCKQTCANIAQAIKLGNYLYLSNSEAESGGRQKTAVLGDALEALIAAIYCDGGFEDAQKFILKFWHDTLKNPTPMIDAKSYLQEWSQSIEKGLPVYQVVERSGPDHQPLFVVKVTIKDHGYALGQGSSKRIAEHHAAENFLESFDEKNQESF